MSSTAAHRSVLVLNSGSSSLKYQLVDAGSGEALASGIIDRVGEEYSNVTHAVGAYQTDRQKYLDYLTLVGEIKTKVRADFNV